MRRAKDGTAVRIDSPGAVARVSGPQEERGKVIDHMPGQTAG